MTEPDPGGSTRLDHAAPNRQRGRDRQPLPTAIAVVVVIALVFVVLPFVGIVARAPWSKAWSVWSSPETIDALVLSLGTSAVAATVAMALGIPVAWWLADFAGALRRWAYAAVLLVLVTPPVVAGVALFSAYGRRGLIGRVLFDWFGVQIPFSVTAVVMAQLFVSLPFVVLTVEAALSQRDRTLDEAARTLGASSWYTMRRVTLPAVGPALIAGYVLAWARALGEFGATITFAGNLPGSTQSMPLLVYLRLNDDPSAALLLAVLLGAVSVTVLVALKSRWFDHVGRPR